MQRLKKREQKSQWFGPVFEFMVERLVFGLMATLILCTWATGCFCCRDASPALTALLGLAEKAYCRRCLVRR